MKIALGLLSVLVAALSIPTSAVPADTVTPMLIVNSAGGKWQHDAGDPAGSESITLHDDPAGTELFARYPAGHVFAPHWHSANERIVLLEGRMSIQDGTAKKSLEPGGFAYLPAKQTQKMACVSSTPCTFYVYWDGKLDFHKSTE